MRQKIKSIIVSMIITIFVTSPLATEAIDSPKISVIIPVYNTERYLEDCLTSIVEQSFSSLEIIIVDDGSTDDSFLIINRYAEKDARIKVLTQENKGAAAARNAGLAVATGEYVAFIDSDDTIDENAYEIAYETAIATNADVVMFGEDRVMVQDKIYDNGLEVLSLPTSILLWNKLYKRSFLQSNDFKLPENIPCYHDECFNCIVLPKAKRVACISDKLYHYRRYRAGSIQTASSVKKKADSIVRSTQLICDNWRTNGYLKNHGHRLLNKVNQMLYRVFGRLNLADKKFYAKTLFSYLKGSVYNGDNLKRLNQYQKSRLESWTKYAKM